jgi:hypothetical protein
MQAANFTDAYKTKLYDLRGEYCQYIELIYSLKLT